MGIKKERRPILTPAVYMDLTGDNGSMEGRMKWNEEDGTMEYGMPGGNVTLQVGQEHLVKVVNKTGITIPDGTPVYVTVPPVVFAEGSM